MDFDMIAQYMASHPNLQLTLAFVAGGIATRPVLMADLAFKAIMRTPLKHVFLMNHEKICEWIDAFQAEMDKNVKAERAADTPKLEEPKKAP